LSKVANFNPPHLYLMDLLKTTPFKFQRDLWHQKIRVPGAITWHCLYDPKFSNSDTILA